MAAPWTGEALEAKRSTSIDVRQQMPGIGRKRTLAPRVSNGWEADLPPTCTGCNLSRMEDAALGALNELLALLAQKPASGRELVTNCRSVISLWISANLPYPHDLLDPIVGIESQTDHLLGGERWPLMGAPRVIDLSQGAEEQQLREVHAFFAAHYQASTAALVQHLRSVGQAT